MNADSKVAQFDKMRLLNVETFEMHEFWDETPEYAILSHTWGDEECNFQQMKEHGVELRIGYQKIKYCCEQAASDGYRWVWVDT